MPDTVELKPLHLCLVAESDLVTAAVRVCCPPPHQVDLVALGDLVNDRNTLAAQGHEMVRTAVSYDVVLIEWNLDKAPLINTLCYHVRQSVGVPLIALCRGTQEAQVAALAAGADEAITFPFYPPFLQAKKTAYHRLVEAARTAGGVGVSPQDVLPGAPHDALQLADLRLDRTARKCYVGEQEVDLTFREFALLDYFLQHAETACTRDSILDHVWGIQFDTGTNMVDVYVYFLRRKLSAHGFQGVIQTVRGYGYRLAIPEQEDA